MAARFTQRLIQRLDGGHLFGRRTRPNRHIADRFTITHLRDSVRAHPIMAAVFWLIFDNAAPRFPLLERAPHIGKRRLGHIRVAHQVVRFAVHLFAAVAADLHKVIVDVGNVAIEVSGRHKRGVFVQQGGGRVQIGQGRHTDILFRCRKKMYYNCYIGGILINLNC